MPDPGDRLRDHAHAVDAARFVGRDAELAVVERLLDPATPERILVVHGVGGIGKSTLLRELARRGSAAGYAVRTFQGRELPPALDLLAARVGSPSHSAPPLVVVDEAEALGDGLSVTRALLLDTLPADGLLVLAGRGAPQREWLDDGTAAITREIALGPLPAADADALLRGLGVSEPARRRRIADWAQGSPLALTIAATTSAGQPLTGAEGDRLLEQLAGREIGGIDPAVLEVAAVAWAVDARLLAAALPGHGTRGAMAELHELSITERIGHRARLHPLVSDALRTRLREQRPQRHRQLVRRIATHLRGRTLDGDEAALLELADLIEDPQVRHGAGRVASATHYADALRPGDLDGLAAGGGLADNAWWHAVRAECEARPEFVTMVRRTGGQVAGMGLCIPADALVRDRPEGDVLVAPLLARLRSAPRAPGPMIALVAELSVEPDAAGAAEVVRVGNGAVVARSGFLSPRHLWVNARRPTAEVEGFLASLGYARLDGLERELGGEPIVSFAVDFGPGGLAGRLHGVVMAETGGPESPAETVHGEGLLDALRNYADADALARGTDGGSADVVARRRREVRDAIAAAFDATPRDAQLRRILELTYLEGRGEQAVLDETHLSRATYYRHLRAARERLVAGWVAPPSDPRDGTASG